jgi:tetratricopeptide (TPR) repeat protein
MSTLTERKWFTPRRAGLVVLILLILIGVLQWRRMTGGHAQAVSPAPASSPVYVGQVRCAQCHASEAQGWQTSHHALAMQTASDKTVLGSFKHASFSKDGVTSTFFTKDGKFYVRTDGADGKPSDFDLSYTFGVFPLQQYLVPFPGGRFQSLVVAWDARLKAQGGQRWFDLYPTQTIKGNDALHWTGSNQTWNYMCADCHSTNLEKNYDLSTESYKTTWSEIDVSCESCHGPGSNHVKWAENRQNQKASYSPMGGGDGLLVSLKDAAGSWSPSDPDTGTMHWKGQPRSRNEINTCAPCHSRRHPITSSHDASQSFLDTFAPSLLDEGVYYADGQILEEDYEWGSFVQSKMYHEGVTCSDCHDPHSAKLPQVSMNSVCGKCHMLSKFGAQEHTHHKVETAGALCVNCHMPTRTYMVVDARRDHSFRVPRPDFSLKYGTPNACNQCHKDKSASWSAEAIAKWYGPNRRQEAHFVEALDAGRRGLPTAQQALTALILDASKPGIARATALTLLPQYLSPAAMPAVQGALADSDSLVRAAAVRALEPLSPQDRVRFAVPLLTDSTRSVRIEAARLLAGTQHDLLQPGQQTALEHAIAELIASETASAERPENHLNLALLYVQMGRASEAEAELHTALRLQPDFIPAMVNLADLCRMQHRDEEGQSWLQNAIAVNPKAAEPIHALGLLKVREKLYKEALALLAKAAQLQPANTRYSYVYAVALQSSGKVDPALAVLKEAHKRRPADRQILVGLIDFERDKGDLPAAITYARQLTQLAPDDPDAKLLLAQLLEQHP